jgi:hypothetical protein
MIPPPLGAQKVDTPIHIRRATGPLVIDGDLGEPAWQDAQEVDRWYEFRPGDNIEPAVASRAWLAYDDRALYVAFDLADPEPARITAPYGDQDDISGNATDFAGIIIDARADGKTATEFLATPRGVKFDAVTDDATGNEDASPDFFWEAAGRITEAGWQMELRIPFSSLRYENRDPHGWGIILIRNYPRDRRYQFASNPIPRGSNCFVCTARKLTGLSSLPPGGHIVSAPYIASSAESVPLGEVGSSLADAKYGSEIGADLKWTPNPDNAVDLTLNPDFSQVESDATQISANERFAILYPEKRPFFLEGVELLSTPLDAVYTRTITSPRWGGRATGEIGPSAYTLLVSQDRGGGVLVLPGPLGSRFVNQESESTVVVSRLRRDFRGNSFVSLLGTAREYEGDSFNRVIGPDFQWRPDERKSLTGQFLLSSTRDRGTDTNAATTSAHAGHLSWSYSNKTFDYVVDYTDISHDFRADSGFIPQVGYRGAIVEGGYTRYPKGMFFHRFRSFVVARREAEIGGETIFQRIAPGFTADGRWSSAWSIFAAAEKVQSGGRVFDQQRLHYHVDLRPTQRITDVCINGWIGDGVDFMESRLGQGASINAGATFRRGNHFSVRLSTSWQWLDIDEGRVFTAQVQRARGTYNFDSRKFLRGIVEYVRTDRDPALHASPVESRDGGLTGSMLFAYKLNWQSVLFVGYGENYGLDENDAMAPTGRQLFLKLSYAFQR